jgi:VanZ family protein
VPQRHPLRLAIAIGWTVLVLILGSRSFGAQATQPWILWLLNLLVPGATPEFVEGVHVFVRKLAHILEYLVHAVLWEYALQLWTKHAAAAAWGISLGVALADEATQSFIPTRTGSLFDVAIDATGAAIGAFLAAKLHRPTRT